jgi:hypothetical protein
MTENQIKELIELGIEPLETRVIENEDKSLEMMKEMDEITEALSSLLAKVSKENSSRSGFEFLLVDCQKTKKRFFLRMQNLEDAVLHRDGTAEIWIRSSSRLFQLKIRIQEETENKFGVMTQILPELLSGTLKSLPYSWSFDNRAIATLQPEVVEIDY